MFITNQVEYAEKTKCSPQPRAAVHERACARSCYTGTTVPELKMDRENGGHLAVHRAAWADCDKLPSCVRAVRAPPVQEQTNLCYQQSNCITQRYCDQVLCYFSPANSDLGTLRRTWWAGFCGLPFLWLLNWLNFRMASQEAGASSEVRLLTRLSLICFSAFAVLLIAWLAYFQSLSESLACPCDGLFGSDRRCYCALGDYRVFSHSECISPEDACPTSATRA